MKKIKMTFAALALVAGLGFAVASNANNNNTTTGTVLHWFSPDGLTYMGDNTKPDEINETGCSGSGDVCERAYAPSQYNNPSSPSQGIKPSELDNPVDAIFLVD